jgi:uncharacterized protein (TIGR02284 family)
MANVNEAAVSTLNDLIETCKDGQNGFRTAAEGVKDSQLKSLFEEYAQQREQFAGELALEVERLGGKPQGSGSVAGAVHRGWLNIKTAVTGGKEDAIISECERGEDVAVRSYEAALKRDLPESVRTIVESQYEEIKEAHDDIRALEKAGSQRSGREF